MGMERYYTRPAANEGRRLPLAGPNGEITGDWIQVRHVYADAFVEAHEAGRRALSEMVLDMGEQTDRKALAAATREARLDALATLIAGWSFEVECTPAAAREFLVNAPQIANQIDGFAADSKRFFGNESRVPKRGSKVKSA